jgi:hypothetical protein
LNIVSNKEIRTSNHLTAGDRLDEKSDLIFDLKDEDDKQFIKDLSGYILPQFDAIRIRNAELYLGGATKFLK